MAMNTNSLILHVEDFEVCGSYSLRLFFNDGTRKRVNVLPLLEGEAFEPLLDPDFFAQARLDPVFGVVEWPNGADFAPEALYELEPEEEPVETELPVMKTSQPSSTSRPSH